MTGFSAESDIRAFAQIGVRYALISQAPAANHSGTPALRKPSSPRISPVQTDPLPRRGFSCRTAAIGFRLRSVASAHPFLRMYQPCRLHSLLVLGTRQAGADTHLGTCGRLFQPRRTLSRL